MNLVRENERVDDLQYKGLKIIQNPQSFCFGTDAVLLANFADVRKDDKIADLGTGTGIIPILLAGRTQFSKCDAVELQPDMVDMARRSVELNGLQDRISVHCHDIKRIKELLPHAGYDCVISNPPYKKINAGIKSAQDSHSLARFELACTLEDILAAANYLLRNGGRLCLIHQSDRIVDIIAQMRSLNMEPKRIRPIQPRQDKPANLIMVEGVKQGKPFCVWEPALCIFDSNGNYTDEMNRIYHRGEYSHD